LRSTDVPKENNEKLAMNIANKIHGSGIDEAAPKKMDDVAKQNITPAKKCVVGTVKSDLKNFGRFLAGKKETNEAKTLSPGQDDVPFDAPYTTDKPQNVKDKSGAVHTPMSRAKDLARSAMKRVNNEMSGKSSGK
jgi:hypothetical protein